MTSSDHSIVRAEAGECVAILRPRTQRARLALDRWLPTGPETLRVGPVDPLFAQMNVRRNVQFPLLARRLGRRDRDLLLNDLLALASLEPVAAGPVRRLAPEQRVRALLARAFAAGRPLLLDDPFAGRSSEERGALQLLLRRLTDRFRQAVILLTSERTELLACGDRIGLPGDTGVRIGPAAAMLDEPGSAEASRLLLEAALFAGRVEDEPLDADEAEIDLACGARMPARLAETVSPGDPCLVAVRSDQVAFVPAQAAELGGAAIPATLVDARNLGDHLRLRVRLQDGSQIWIRRPVASLTAHQIARASEPLGASLAWRASHAVAYPHA